MASIATSAPSTIYSGDSVIWAITLADYPASDGWTLKYSLRLGKGGLANPPILIESQASGDVHIVTALAASTATWPAGIYAAVGYVTKDADRVTVWTGSFEVKPNLADADEDHDPRSKARQILDFIEESWAKVAAKQAVSSSVAGVTLNFRSMDELIRARNYWASIDAAEQVKKSGKLRYILTKFSSPQ